MKKKEVSGEVLFSRASQPENLTGRDLKSGKNGVRWVGKGGSKESYGFNKGLRRERHKSFEITKDRSVGGGPGASKGKEKMDRSPILRPPQGIWGGQLVHKMV